MYVSLADKRTAIAAPSIAITPPCLGSADSSQAGTMVVALSILRQDVMWVIAATSVRLRNVESTFRRSFLVRHGYDNDLSGAIRLSALRQLQPHLKQLFGIRKTLFGKQLLMIESCNGLPVHVLTRPRAVYTPFQHSCKHLGNVFIFTFEFILGSFASSWVASVSKVAFNPQTTLGWLSWRVELVVYRAFSFSYKFNQSLCCCPSRTNVSFQKHS